MYYTLEIKKCSLHIKSEISKSKQLIFKKKFVSLQIQQFNYLPFLLHNFTGFLTLDTIIKKIHKGVSEKHKLFVISGNVVKFEYRYKFEDINLRALKPKQNELYIFIDFGLKRILQFNSKQFYLSKNAIIETSDRVNALFYKLDTHFEDELTWSCSFNARTLSALTKKSNGLLSLPLFNLNSLKFFVDDFILKNSFFSYTNFIQQLMVHAFYVQFFNFNFFNFYYGSFIYGINKNFTLKSLNVVINGFLNVFHANNWLAFQKGFLWYQQRVKGYYFFKHTYYVKTAPYLLRRRLYRFYYNEQFNLKKKKIGLSKLYNRALYSQNLNSSKVFTNKKFKVKLFLNFLLNLYKTKGHQLKSLNKFKLSVLKQFFFKTNILYFLKLKIKSNYIFKIKKIFLLLCKRYKQYTFNLIVSSFLNKNNKVQTSVFINNLVYIDSGFLLKKKKNNKNALSRVNTHFFSVKKKVFLIKKNLRKIFVKKLFDVKNKQKLNLKLKPKISKVKYLTDKNVFSKRLFIKSLTKLLSINQQFYFKNWFEERFNYSIANFFGAVPFAFLYKGFNKSQMYLFYKKNFAILCNQLEFLHLVLRYFWLTNYLKRLTFKNITKLQFFKIKKDNINSFNFKLSLNDYLIKLIRAFGYNLIIKMQNFDFMTRQVSSLIASATQKKMKFFWRTIKTEVAPSMVENFTKLCQSNFVFLRFSLLFIMFYNFFLYHKRFNFKVAGGFWKGFLRLKENFNLLFIKETPVSFVFSKDYYVFFFKLIIKHKLLFFRLLFYLKKFLKIKNNLLFSLKNLPINKFVSFLNSMLFFKKNIFKFSVFFFFNFFYKINLKYNIFFTQTKNYLNYKTIYNKLFFTLNNSLKINILYKKKFNFTSNFKQFFFNVKSIKNVFSYNHLLNIWSWNIFTLFNVNMKNSFNMHKKILLHNNNYTIFNYLEKSFFLFNLKLKQKKINLSKVINNDTDFSYKKKTILFISTSVSSLNHLNIKHIRHFSTDLSSIKKFNFYKTSSLSYFLFKNKFLLKRKKFKNLKRYYFIFYFFNKYKNIKFFYLYRVFKKLNFFKKIFLNKKRLNKLFKYSNLLDNFYLLSKLFNSLFNKFKIINIRKKFLINYILNSIFKNFFKNSHVLYFKNIKTIIVSTLYALIFYSRKKITNNLYFLIKNVNYLCEQLLKNNVLQAKRTLKYLTFFTNKVNFMFFKNIYTATAFFKRQSFYLYCKFKSDEVYLPYSQLISSNRGFTYRREKEFLSDLFDFKCSLLRNYNDIFFYLNNMGFCYLTKLSIINLFFFNHLKFNKLNLSSLKKFKNVFVNCSLLTFSSELKRLRFFIFILNKLLRTFFNKNKSRIKNIFYLFNFLNFKLLLKANRFKKKLLFKYNYPFFFNNKQKTHGVFSRSYFLKKQYQLLRFVYLYGGSRFYKRKTKSDKKVTHKLNKFLRPLSLSSKKRKINNKKKRFKKQYNRYLRFKSSLRTAFKIKLFTKSLRKFGFKVSTFFLWIIPKKKWAWSNSRYKNSVRRVLWNRGKDYSLNKLSFIKCVLYSYSNPFKIRYSFTKRNFLDPDDNNLKWLIFANKFINPTKQYVFKRYNINHFFGFFFKYPKSLCLTRRKKRRIWKKRISLRFLVRFFKTTWINRFCILLRSRKTIARGDSVWLLKKHIRKLKSKKFYFIWKFLFSLTKTKEAKFFLTPFSKKITYNKYFYRPNRKELSEQEEKEEEIKIIGRTTWSYLRLLRRIKRRYLIKAKKNKKSVDCYNKFYVSKSINKFRLSQDKKLKPPFRHYYNLEPWHNKLASEKILKFHNALFFKYRQQINKINSKSYLYNPIFIKYFKNLKKNKFFRLNKKLKHKLNVFKKSQHGKKSRGKK